MTDSRPAVADDKAFLQLLTNGDRRSRDFLRARATNARSRLTPTEMGQLQKVTAQWDSSSPAATFDFAKFMALRSAFAPFGPHVVDAALANWCVASVRAGRATAPVQALAIMSSDSEARRAIQARVLFSACRSAAEMGHMEARSFLEPLRRAGIDPAEVVAQFEAGSRPPVPVGNLDSERLSRTLDRRREEAFEILNAARPEKDVWLFASADDVAGYERRDKIRKALAAADYATAGRLVPAIDRRNSPGPQTPRAECTLFRDEFVALLESESFDRARECLAYSPYDPPHRQLMSQIMDKHLADHYRADPSLERLHRVRALMSPDIGTLYELIEDPSIRDQQPARELQPQEWMPMGGEALFKALRNGATLKVLNPRKELPRFEEIVKRSRGLMSAGPAYYGRPLEEVLRPKPRKGRIFVGSMIVDISLLPKDPERPEGSHSFELNTSLYTTGQKKAIANTQFSVVYSNTKGRESRRVEATERSALQGAADSQTAVSSSTARLIETAGKAKPLGGWIGH